MKTVQHQATQNDLPTCCVVADPLALPPPLQKLTYQPNDLTELLGIGRNSVYALIRSGRIRSIQVGRKIIIPRSAVDDFLAGKL